VTPPSPTQNSSPTGGYGPSDLQSAYNLTSSTAGAGQTVAIVDAYDHPNAASDLVTYRAQYGLTTINDWSSSSTPAPWFRKINQSGGTSYPAADSGWGVEIDLDIEMVSAICPNCNILLVEATSATMGNLGAAVNEAVKLGANEVSNSYIGGESSLESLYDSAYYKHPGVAITAASGDSGYGVGYPAASQYVVAVGGTSLTESLGTWTEMAWSGAGSGCSSYEAKPSWQTDTGCSKRTVADVSAVADPYTGVNVYDSYGSYDGWYVFGGTSVSSPIIASVYALAGGPAAGSYPASYPYTNANSSNLHDVTSGSNGSCGGSYLCTAGPGYDGPTGLGTPNGTTAFAAPGGPTPDFTLSASPNSQTVTAGGTTPPYTVTVAPSNGFSGSVSLSASGLPSGASAIFNPNSVTGGSGTSNLTIATSSSTPAGTYPVMIGGISGSLAHTTSVTLVVNAAPVTGDFTLSASPTSRSIRRGQSTSYAITITRTGGFTGAVSFSVTSGLPSGTTGTFSPNPTSTTGTSSTLRVTTSRSASAGTSTLTITGSSGSLTSTATVTLTLQ
jgi:subtilase family serine protease